MPPLNRYSLLFYFLEVNKIMRTIKKDWEEELERTIQELADIPVPAKEPGFDARGYTLHELKPPEYPFMESEFASHLNDEIVIVWCDKKTKTTTIHIDDKNDIRIPKELLNQVILALAKIKSSDGRGGK